MTAIGHGRLGLATGRRTFDAWAQASASAKRVHVEARPRLMVTEWSVYSGATYVATMTHTFDSVLVAVTGVRHGLSTVPLVRAETLADCVATAGTFYFDATQIIIGGGVAHWDDGETHWDVPMAAAYDQAAHLYVHLPDGASPLTTQVAAELSFWWSNEGEVVPDFGPEKLSNGGFESWDNSETPSDWTTETNSGAVAVAEDADELVGGFRSIRLTNTGGAAGEWDDGVTVWDEVDGVSWDTPSDPLLAVSQPVSIRTGHTYRLSGAYRTAEENDPTFNPYIRFGIPPAAFIDEDGFSTAGDYILLPSTRGDWRRFVLDFMGWTDSDAAELELRAWAGGAVASPAPSGSVWFDDVRLRCIWRWVFAAPRLADVPPAQQSSRDVFFGGKSTGGGNLSVINADGKLEPELSSLTWEGAEVRFRAGGDFANGERILAEDFVPAFAGLIDTAETNDQTIGLAMRDAGEFFNIQVPPNTYTQAEFSALPDNFSGQPKPVFFGPKTGIAGVPIALTASGYRTYELCDVTGSPAGIKSVDAVYAYVDEAAANLRDTARRLTLAAGTDYSTNLALARVTLLTDARLYEVTSDHNLLDFNEGGSAIVAELTPGFYSARTLQVMAQAAIRAVGNVNNALAYSDTTHLWTWSRASGTLSLLRKTGASKAVGAWALFGFTASEDDLTGAITYTGEEPTFDEPDRQHVIRIDATGIVDDASGTYTGTPNAAIQLMPDIVRYLVSVIARRPEAVDDFTFRESRATAPQVLGLYLRERVNLREVLDRMEYSSGADIVLDGDGMFYVIVADDEVPPNVVDLYDRDFLSFTMGSSVRDVLRTITLKFDEDASTGKFRTRETTNDDVALRYGRSPSREFETYLTDDADAVARVEALAVLASSARRIANVSVKGKLTRARIGSKVRLTRSRGVSTTGRLDGELFRVLSIEKTHLEAVATASLVEV